MIPIPEGPHLQLLGNQAAKYTTIEGIMGLNSLIVVHVDPLGMIREQDVDFRAALCARRCARSPAHSCTVN